MSESERHRTLKALAMRWLVEKGCDGVAFEVRLPDSNFRVDAAGYRSMRGSKGQVGETFALECKQSRADFLKDAAIEEQVADERHLFVERKALLQQLMAMHLPQCRLNESLFIEYDQFDFSNWRHEAWKEVSAKLGVLENQLRQGIKFSKIIRYGCANHCYLVVEPGVVKSAREIPMGWGCLERDGERLRLIQERLRVASRMELRLKFLERIAARNSRSCRVMGNLEASER